jgi:uncharacterized membrane protein YkoI
MKINHRGALVCAAFAGLAAMSHAFAAEPSQAQLRAEAKVTETEATATALAKVPQGSVKSVELEREKGKLVWSFDIARPRATGVTEIQVDAVTGKIVSFKRETVAQEAKEATAEAKEPAPRN